MSYIQSGESLKRGEGSDRTDRNTQDGIQGTNPASLFVNKSWTSIPLRTVTTSVKRRSLPLVHPDTVRLCPGPGAAVGLGGDLRGEWT